jgi:hypothetical protein
MVIAAIFSALNIYASEPISLLDKSFEETKKNVCENEEFLGCIGMSETRCNEILDSSFKSCSPLFIDGLDIEVYNPLCGSDFIVEKSGIPVEVFEDCSESFLPKVRR